MREHRHYQDSDLMRRRGDAARVLRAYRFVRQHSVNPELTEDVRLCLRGAAHMATKAHLGFDFKRVAEKLAVLTRSA